MNRQELAEIKARADEVKAILESVPFLQDLLEHDVPQLIAEVDRLNQALAAARCPHGEPYEDRSCVRCFGDGTEEMRECSQCRTQSWHRGGKCLRHDQTAPKPYEAMKRELEELRSRAVGAEGEKLAAQGRCPHGEPYEDRSCVRCFGDGTEEMRECSQCRTESWHRGGKCLRHDQTAPKPYEAMKRELELLRSRIRILEEECAARIEVAEGRVHDFQASHDVMREALEYIKPRIGSSNLGESMAKINRALSSLPLREMSAEKDRPGKTSP